MYTIITTEDFIALLEEIPIKYLLLLTASFMSIEKTDINENDIPENTFLDDLLEQMRNQELE